MFHYTYYKLYTKNKKKQAFVRKKVSPVFPLARKTIRKNRKKVSKTGKNAYAAFLPRPVRKENRLPFAKRHFSFFASARRGSGHNRGDVLRKEE